MNQIPRRANMDKWTLAERAIHTATQAVETLGCDIYLSRAVNLLQEARDNVADFVDGVNYATPVNDCSACPCYPHRGVAYRSNEAMKRCGHENNLVAMLREHMIPEQGEDAYLRIYPCDARKLVPLLNAAIYLLDGGQHDGKDETCDVCKILIAARKIKDGMGA